MNRFVFYAFKFLSALLQLYAWQFLARSPKIAQLRRIPLLKLSEKPHELANLLAISRLIAT